MAEDPQTEDRAPLSGEATYTRREALAAMTKYSAAVGGAASTIVTAEGLVSAASAYPAWLSEFCTRRPDHWMCTWEGWETWESNGNGQGNGNGRIQF